MLVAERGDAVDLLRHVVVPVEHERGRVRVRAHVTEDQPVSHLSPLKRRADLVANLVEAVAGGAKDGSREQLLLRRGLGPTHSGVESLRNGVEVVIDYVVE